MSAVSGQHCYPDRGFFWEETGKHLQIVSEPEPMPNFGRHSTWSIVHKADQTDDETSGSTSSLHDAGPELSNGSNQDCETCCDDAAERSCCIGYDCNDADCPITALECSCCKEDGECWSPLPSGSSARSYDTSTVAIHSIFDDYPMSSVEASPTILTRIPSYEFRPLHYYEPANPHFLDIKLKSLQMSQKRREREESEAKTLHADTEGPIHEERWQRALQFAAFHRTGSAGSLEQLDDPDTVPFGLRILLRRVTL